MQLEKARVARGRSLDDIASQTKINRRHLEAIEAGDLTRLPQGPYVKAFIREFARAVGVTTPPEFAHFTGAPGPSPKDPKVVSHLISEKGVESLTAPLTEAARETAKFANTAVRSAVKSVTKTTENVAHIVESSSKEALEVLTSKSLWEEAESVRRERLGLPPLPVQPKPEPNPVIAEAPQPEPKPTRTPRTISKRATNGVIALLVLLFAGAMYFTVRMYRSERSTTASGTNDYIPAPVEPTAPAPAPKHAESTVTATTPAVAAPTAAKDSLLFTLRATQLVWVSIAPDGLPAYRGQMRAGETRTVRAAQKIVLNIGNQKSVEMQLDGQKLSNLPTVANSNVVIRNLVLTKNHANLEGHDVDWKVLTSAPPPAQPPAVQHSVVTATPAHTIPTTKQPLKSASKSAVASHGTVQSTNGSAKPPMHTSVPTSTPNKKTQVRQPVTPTTKRSKSGASSPLRTVDPIPPGP